MTPNIIELIKSDGRFQILTKVLERTGVGETMINQQKTLTFFAPTDAAFAELSGEDSEQLSEIHAGQFIAAVLGRHIVPDAYFFTDDLRRRNSVKALDGSELKISERKNMLQLEGAPVFTPGITSRNGVVFAVNKILLFEQNAADAQQKTH